MFVIGHFLLLGFSCAITKATTYQKSLMCLDCPLVSDSSHCSNYHKVGHDESCSTTVHELRGILLYTFSFKKKTECPLSHSLFGKREGAHQPYNFNPSTLRCVDCCDTGTACNRMLCANHQKTLTPQTQAAVIHVTTPVTTPTSTTPQQATTTQGNFQTQQTTTTTQVPVQTHSTLFPCIDFEDQSFSCTVWASNGYCQPIPGTGYELAKLRCRKHCGFC